MDFNHDLGSISSVKILDPDTGVLTVSGSAGLVLPIGTTAERAPATGVIRFNSTTSFYEGFNGTEWVPFQGSNSNLLSLANLSGTGLVVQTAPGTFSEISIAGTAGNIVVTNGDGVAGNPTVNLATAGTAGSGYVSVTTDAFGRVTAGATTQAWSTITGTPTTLAGYGITDAILNAGGIVSFDSGLFASIPAAGTVGAVYYATDTQTFYFDNGTSWDVIVPAFSGDVSSTAGSTTLTLATVNSNVGTFGSSTQIPVLTVNAKGLVTGVTTTSISTALSYIGDVSGTGTTGTDTTLTLATVNSTVGTFGDSSHVGQFTVNAKGLVTAASDVLITPAAIGAINIDQLGVAGGVATLDGTGKLTAAQIPDALIGALQYQGVWDATANSPALASGVGVKGQYYKVGVAGTTTIDGDSAWQLGDFIIFNGTTWDHVDGGSSEVIAVNGKIGNVQLLLASADFANQGTTTTFLKGDAAGNPSWSSVSLSTDVSGTLQASQFPAVSGDISTTAGSLVTTLATVNTNVGSFGSSTSVGTFTVNGKGLITAAADVAIPLDVTIGGDATGTGTTSTTTTITLATVNSNVGSFGSATAVPVLTVNEKGLVTAVSTTSISSAIALVGDVTGTGTTGANLTTTLATVNSNVGSFGASNKVGTFTVNAKGLVTAAADVTITPAAIGAVANAGGTPSILSDLFANIPAAGNAGAVFIATDSKAIYRDNGTSWDQIGESAVLYTENPVSPVSSTVTGTNSVSIGSGNVASGANSIATGEGASTSLYGAQVHANGSFANPGDAQSGKYILRTITSNGSTTETFLDGTSARIVLPNNSAFTYTAQVVARRTDQTGFEGAWKIEGLISRDASAATTTLVGNRSKTILTKPTGWNVEVAADTANGALVFNVTGATSQTVRWVITVTTTEVAQ